MTIASQTLDSALTGWLGAARQLRQVIHADPRLSRDETATAGAVLGALPPDLAVTPVAGYLAACDLIRDRAASS